MTALAIKDVPRTEALDRRTMAALLGGAAYVRRPEWSTGFCGTVAVPPEPSRVPFDLMPTPLGPLLVVPFGPDVPG